VDFEAYLESVRDRLQLAGSREESAPPSVTLMARRRQIKVSRSGINETVVAVSTIHSQPGPDQLRSFGAEIVSSALDGKTTRLPRGLGSSFVVYPVLVAAVISEELSRFTSSYAPKHWCILEFPVVVDAAMPSLVLRNRTPIWGAAYYRTTRREAHVLLAPQ
jgi:hypothetical protein